MRRVEVFETSGVAIPGSHYGFHFGQIELSLFRHLTIANSRPSEPFLLLSALAQVSFPAVPATKPAVEEVIAVHTWNLEADVSEVCSRDDRLLALAGGDDFSEFHGSPPQVCLLFFVGKLVSQRFQILIRFLQTSACLVDGSEHFEIVDSDPPFGLVRFEKFQDNEHFFVERILRRIIRQELDLGYEVIPRDIAHDVNRRRTLLRVCYKPGSCRLKPLLGQTADLEISAVPRWSGIATPCRNQLPEPSLRTGLPPASSPVLVGLRMLRA